MSNYNADENSSFLQKEINNSEKIVPNVLTHCMTDANKNVAEGISNDRNEICTRCGRHTHSANICFARTNVEGNEILEENILEEI